MHAHPEPELPLTPTTVMLPKPFAHAFPAIATEADMWLPSLLADAVCNLMVTTIENELIAFASANHAEYVFLSKDGNWARIVELFRKAGFPETCKVLLSYEVKPPEIKVTPEPIKPKAQKHNKLSGQAMVKLIDWMRRNEDAAKTDPDSKLATLASTALEMTVTVSNIASVREALGIAKIKPTAPPSVEERLARLECVLGTLISWSVRHQGAAACEELLNTLKGIDTSKKAPTDAV